MSTDLETIARAIDPSGWIDDGYHTKEATARRELSLKAAGRVLELFRQRIVSVPGTDKSEAEQ